MRYRLARERESVSHEKLIALAMWYGNVCRDTRHCASLRTDSRLLLAVMPLYQFVQLLAILIGSTLGRNAVGGSRGRDH